MIFGIPLGVLLITLEFYIPHALLLWFIVAAFKKWKQNNEFSFAWKAAFISSIPSFVVLILMSLRPTHEAFFGPRDPFFFIPLLVRILFFAVPITLGILLVGWCLLLVSMAVRGEINKVQIESVKRRCMVPIILTIVIIFYIIFSIVTG